MQIGQTHTCPAEPEPDSRKTIKIAPDLEEVTVSGDSVTTSFAGGITYTAPGLGNYKDEYIRANFRAAIALSSKTWQIKALMDKHLNLEGTITTP